MIKIVRTIECPKEWTKDRLKGMYPGYTILGNSSYGWWHVIEATKCIFLNYGFNELVRDVAKHYKGNNVPIPANLSLAIQAQYCANTGSEVCQEDDGQGPRKARLYEQAARFLRTVADAVASGEPLVPQEEANRRAAICAECPLNGDEDTGCSGCGSQNALAAAAKFVLGKSTPLDDRLKVCGHCGCTLKLKVWTRRDSMDFPDLRSGWSPQCWMRAENASPPTPQ